MTEQRKIYSIANFATKGVVAQLSGRVGFEVTVNENTADDGTTRKFGNTRISVQNQVPTMKRMVEAANGNPDAIKVVTGKNGDEYVSVRLTGFDGMADRMAKAMKVGDIVGVFGPITVQDYNGETQINLAVRGFEIKHRYNGETPVSEAADIPQAAEDDSLVELTAAALDEMPDDDDDDLAF